ncbi:hypothetical protein BCR33DRAFT_790723 [Rhizoclosmatium globosum]|uniref:S-adenosyl-L-methionine-dependent methyltransferase n=1 Tax=Rhizoclosmatium globosum TaxID=329046 RepID=A0A1Y2BK74_9FUNG|nr:hypothetical protein BCR33DRAFT_790723 [Rhizoclosmatium globosum]|eukprot:ORY35163.1 hypothetical protein BCR33DRAFT_790723 [Rhizoclosmatium globosum]
MQTYPSVDIETLETCLLSVDKRSVKAVIPVLDQINSFLSARSQFTDTTLEKHISNWLTSVMSVWTKRVPLDSVDLDCEMERVANLLACISDVPVVASQWVRRMELDGDTVIDVHEMSCTDEDVGANVWKAGCLFAYFIARKKIPVPTSPILELGCGTAVVGIAAAKYGAKHVYATDYLDKVLDNAIVNVEANGCADAVSVLKLDWAWVSDEKQLPLTTILSDKAGARIYITTELRVSRFSNYTIEFEERMVKSGFRVVFCEDFGRKELLDWTLDGDLYGKRVVEDLFKSGKEKRFRYYVYERGVAHSVENEPTCTKME